MDERAKILARVVPTPPVFYSNEDPSHMERTSAGLNDALSDRITRIVENNFASFLFAALVCVFVLSNELQMLCVLLYCFWLVE